MRVVDLDLRVMCPPCRTEWARVVLEDDEGRDRITCPTCARRYWRVGASVRFTDHQDGTDPVFKVFVPDATPAAQEDPRG